MNTPYNRNDYANARQPDAPIYTQRQLDLAVAKERERCAEWLSKQRNETPATGIELAQAMRYILNV